ncbi:hypothetical protein TRICI_002066 [Trichomonascus ciferrii]|uniref:Uncharacterized protein n=1 Tax=Trichomonascus ciferrii TaxID=44093 RepID=A0A642V6R5_9ASCO|nr:hypothetical protein TRICI_002066 [Trichomonascus ciferrii]
MDAFVLRNFMRWQSGQDPLRIMMHRQSGPGPPVEGLKNINTRDISVFGETSSLLTITMKVFSTLAKLSLLLSVVVAFSWQIDWRNQAIATAGIIASCGGHTSPGSLTSCLVGALASVFMAIAAGWRNGQDHGTAGSNAKRDLALYDAIPHNVFDTLSIANDAVYTLFPDNHWRLNVDASLFNETVLEQVTPLGKTFVTRKDDTVQVSLVHPDEKAQKYDIDQETGLKTKREPGHNFGDFVAHYKDVGKRKATGQTLNKDEARHLADTFIRTVTDNGDTKLNIAQYCTTIKDDRMHEADVTIAIEATDYTFQKYQPACGA